MFNRWHAPLRRRLEQVAQGQAPGLVLAVDRSVLKRAASADLVDNPLLDERGCPFSSFPALRR